MAKASSDLDLGMDWPRRFISPSPGKRVGLFLTQLRCPANLNNARDPNRRLLVGNYRSVPIQLSATVLTLPQYVMAEVLKGCPERVASPLFLSTS